MTEKQFAAGGVVLKGDAEEVKALLIKDSYGHWTWPKGHIEEGESPREAALREVQEETGLKTLNAWEELGTQKYWFTWEGEKVFKTVHIFLIEATEGEELSIQTEEITDGEWLEADQALEKIEYEGSRALFEKGIKKYKEGKTS
ncbi:NUDIX hydrolase [Candidatus Omnitrophota bacterium]